MKRSSAWGAGASVAVLATSMLLAGCGSGAQTTTTASATPINIGVITTLTGPLGPYGQEWMRGFHIGLEYATNGTDEINGHKITYTVKDDGGNPSQAVQEAKTFLATDKVNILAGGVSSASAIAVEPLAQKYQTVYVAGPAVADSITGKFYNPYVFKISPNSYMEAKAAVLAIQDPGATVAQLAPDYSFGWDSVKAFKTLAEQAGMKDILDLYASPTATDFTPQIERIIKAHPKYLFVTWAGAPGPWTAIQQMGVQKQGITIDTGIPNIAAIQALFQGYNGMKGFTTYYYKLPNNPINTYLIQHDQSEYQTVPDLFDPDGMAAAIAIVKGIEKANGSTKGSDLIQAMAGMSFDGPKGPYQFRAQDHQAMQSLYGVVLENQPGVNYPVPTLTKELTADQLTPPINN